MCWTFQLNGNNRKKQINNVYTHAIVRNVVKTMWVEINVIRHLGRPKKKNQRSI